MPGATVATFNIRHGRGLDGRVDLARTAATIERTGADLIALQELDRFHPRSGKVDQPRELEQLTGMNVTFAATLATDGREYGTALAARGEAPTETSLIDLPMVAAEERRRVLVARWRGLQVVATHLSVDPRSNAAQQEALAEIAARLRPPVLVMGDMNAPRGRLDKLAEEGFVAARPFGGTLHPWWRFRLVDHVLAGPGVEILSARTLPTRGSDHRPVAVSLRWGVEDVIGVTYDA